MTVTRKTGVLQVVGTPIGNMEDLGPRALRVLGESDIVAAEDTRRTGLMLARLGIKRRLMSLFEGNEHHRAGAIVEALRAGEQVALVSEGGMPGISDPGAVLVRACLEAGLSVSPVPGPTAVTTLVSVSGLGDGRFRFEGFLPKKGSERARRIAWLRRDPVPSVIYEAPTRIAKTLTELAEALGPRRAVLGREMTKLHEEFIHGSLPELAQRLAGTRVKGEVTLVVEGADVEAVLATEKEIVELLRAALRQGESPRDAARQVAEATGWSRKDTYSLAMGLGDP